MTIVRFTIARLLEWLEADVLRHRLGLLGCNLIVDIGDWGGMPSIGPHGETLWPDGSEWEMTRSYLRILMPQVRG